MNALARFLAGGLLAWYYVALLAGVIVLGVLGAATIASWALADLFGVSEERAFALVTLLTVVGLVAGYRRHLRV